MPPTPELRASIIDFGILQPLVVIPSGDTYVVLEGRKRFQIAHELGLDEVPAFILDPPERARAEIRRWHGELTVPSSSQAERVDAILKEAASRGMVAPEDFERFKGLTEGQAIEALRQLWDERKGAARAQALRSPSSPEALMESGGFGLEQIAVDTIVAGGLRPEAPSPAPEADPEPAAAGEPGAAAPRDPLGSLSEEDTTAIDEGELLQAIQACAAPPESGPAPARRESAGRPASRDEVNQNLRRLLIDVKTRGGINGSEFDRAAQALVMSRQDDPYEFLSWGSLGAADPVADHSILVARMCVHLATGLKWTKLQIARIGIAGLVHDIGLVAVGWNPRSAGAGGEERSGEEATEIDGEPAAHIACGLRLIGEARTWGSQILSTCADHHERWDGSGEPGRKREDAVDLPARIVGFLDAFALLVRPWRGEPLTPHDAVVRLGDLTREGRFDAMVFSAFLAHFSAWPMGSVLRLADGRIAQVIGTDVHRPTSPRVRILVPTVERDIELALAGPQEVAEDLSLGPLGAGRG